VTLSFEAGELTLFGIV